MGRSHKKGQGRGGANPKNRSRNGPIEWTPKMTMNVLDLSRDDDFLNHLLVEKLGTGVVPLYVHKMDPKRPLPKTDPKDLMSIVQRLIVAKGPFPKAIKQAVDELLKLHGVITFLKKFSQPQIDSFATHASRYFELYSPDGCIEIAHTSRYTHKTGKSELCILATRKLLPGSLITELKGSMAKLTREDERAMKNNGTIRMDFSVIHSGQMKKNHLFLGPARFVNHDCDNNCEIYREGKYITFKVLKKIERGEEITAHYGDGYFGRRNRHCLCATCEKHGTGGYADPIPDDELSESSSDSSSDSETSSSESDEDVKPAIPLNMNERRTRRGVYHTQDTVVNSDEEDKSKEQSAETDKEPEKVVDDWKIPKIEESEQVIDLCSDLSSLSSASTSISQQAGPSRDAGLMTPDTEAEASSSVQVTPTVTTPDSDATPSKSTPSTPYKSSISTRRQKTAASVASLSVTSTRTAISKKVKIETIEQNHLVTPPPSVEGVSPSNESITPVFEKRVTRSVSSAQKSVGRSRGSTSTSPTKGKGRASEIFSIDDDEEERKPEVTRVLRARPSALKLFESPVKAEVPRDERGRPLPTCNTCNDILPIIHVDQEVVWGNGKKKEMTECPRCMRHFAIYNYPWPARTASQRVLFMPTPREELTPVDSSSRKVSARVLPALDKKLAAAIKSPLKSRRREFAVEEPPAKKQKTDRGAKDIVSSSGRTTSGRHSLPSTKVREHSEKRPVGRPRLTTPPHRTATVTKTTVKIESVSAPVDSRKFFNRPPPPRPKSNKSMVAADQPRDGSGRFGIKEATGGKYQRRNTNTPDSRAQRALERERMRAQLEARTAASGDESDDESDNEGEVETPLRNLNGKERKRRKEVGFELRESPRKKTRVGQDDDKNQLTPSRTYVYGKPNPFAFARRSWAPKPRPALEVSSDSEIELLDGSSKSVKRTVTFESETGQDWRAHLVTSTAQEMQEEVSPITALTLKPTPFTYARRRWSSDLWKAKSSRMLSRGSEPLDGEDSDAEESDDEEGEPTDVNIDFSKRYAAFYVGARQDMACLDESSSGEEDVFGAERPDYALQRKASFSNRGVPNASNSDKT